MVFAAIQTGVQTGIDALRNTALTTIPVEDAKDPTEPLKKEAWGQLGELAYPAGAFEISRRNPSGSRLTAEVLNDK